ncbi:MAG: cell division protein FtsX [Pseudomonadota bacterium]
MSVFGAVKRLFVSEETAIAPKAGIIGGLITVVSIAMSFLAVAAFEAGVAANRIAGEWTGELAQSATVRISAPQEDIDAVAIAALRTLEFAPGVASARILSDEELQTLLAPWLGRDADIAALPLPALIDVKVEGTGPDVADVQRQLDLAAPGAVYDDHGEWRAPLIEAALGLRRLAIVGVALTLIALAAMVGVAAVATLWSGATVVRTLRLIGAEDRFISRAFERQFSVRAAIGGLIGAGAAMFAMTRLPNITSSEILMAGVSPEGATWWLLAATPLVCAATALWATKTASYFVLRRTD